MSGPWLLCVFLLSGEKIERGGHRSFGAFSSHSCQNRVLTGARDKCRHDGVGAGARSSAELVLGRGALERFPDGVVFTSSGLLLLVWKDILSIAAVGAHGEARTNQVVNVRHVVSFVYAGTGGHPALVSVQFLCK